MTVQAVTATYRAITEQGDGLIKRGRVKLAVYGEPQADWLHDRNITSDQVTGFRLLLSVPICMLLAYHLYWLASLLILVGAWTDNIDGILAIKEGKPKGSIGGLFDSMVDKIYVISIIATMYLYSPFRAWFMTSIIFGEAIYGLFAVLYLLTAIWIYGVTRETALKNLSSNSWGRAKMTLEICSAISLTIFLSTNLVVFMWVAQILGWASVKFLTFSFFGKLRNLELQ